MPRREGPAPVLVAKQPADTGRVHGPTTTAPSRPCRGAAAQLAALHDTLRHGPSLQPQGAGSAARGEPAPQPRAPAANRTGLPDRLKAGIEALSGFSMDDVKVHYGSDKPAQLEALAYTQGIDIHVGAGEEKHLPHEAWHVVQQKQGQVTVTRQMGAMGVNDDGRLEREADVMGERAMNVPTGLAPSTEKSGLSAAAPAVAVAQLKPEVLIQASAAATRPAGAGAGASSSSSEPEAKSDAGEYKSGNSEQETIASIQVVTRPSNAFPGTEGAHTTAFLVQEDALRRAVEGRTYAEAWEGVAGLFRQSMGLPGFEWAYSTDNETHRDRFRTAKANVEERLAAGLTDAEGYREQLAKLVCDYLEYRNLILFTTFNVLQVGGGTGGRGEGDAAAPLREFELRARGGNAELTPEQRRRLYVAAGALLDTASVSLMAIYTGEDLEEKAPGISGLETVLERLEAVCEQHFLGLQSAYPLSLEAMGLTNPGRMVMMIPQLGAALTAAASAEMEHSLRRIKALRARLADRIARYEAALKPKDQATELAEIDKFKTKLLLQRQRNNELGKIWDEIKDAVLESTRLCPAPAEPGKFPEFTAFPDNPIDVWSPDTSGASSSAAGTSRPKRPGPPSAGGGPSQGAGSASAAMEG